MQSINGVHLIVDAYVSNSESLSETTMLHMFDELVSELRMQYLGSPVVHLIDYNEELLPTDMDEGGISIIVPITTSHMSAHCWPLRRAVMLDIFSCLPFNTDAAVDIIDSHLEFTHFNVQVIDRKDPIRTNSRPSSNSWAPWNRG